MRSNLDIVTAFNGESIQNEYQIGVVTTGDLELTTGNIGEESACTAKSCSTICGNEMEVISSASIPQHPAILSCVRADSGANDLDLQAAILRAALAGQALHSLSTFSTPPK